MAGRIGARVGVQRDEQVGAGVASDPHPPLQRDIGVAAAGHHHPVAAALQPRQRSMRGIRRDVRQSGAAHVVEVEHEIGVPRKALGRGDILDPVLLPQPSGRAEGVDPAFGGNACAGEDDDAFDLCHEAFKHEA